MNIEQAYKIHNQFQTYFDGYTLIGSSSLWMPFYKKEIEVEYKTLYATRRTYVSMMRQSDQISLEDIQDVVGHKKGSAITDRHYNLDVLEDAHKKKKAEHKSKIFNSLLNIA